MPAETSGQNPHKMNEVAQSRTRMKLFFDPYYQKLKNIYFENRLSFLILGSRIEKGLNRSHEIAIKRKFRIQSELKESTSVQTTNQQPSSSTHIPEVWPWVKVYRDIGEIFRWINLIKYLCLLLIFDAKLLPIEYNCYLPLWGRLNVLEAMYDVVVISTFFTLLFAHVWPYLMSYTGGGFELDAIEFLACKEESVKDELLKMKPLTTEFSYSDVKFFPNTFPDNPIQRIHFYSIDCDNSTFIHRRKPNRFEHQKRRLMFYTDFILVGSILIYTPFTLGYCICTAVMALFDKYNIQTYPTCCPKLEQMAFEGLLKPWQITFNLCSIKPFTSLLDIGVGIITVIDAVSTLHLPFTITTILTLDLIEYWSIIDRRVKSLVKDLNSNGGFEEEITPLKKYYIPPLKSTSTEWYLSKRSDTIKYSTGVRQATLRDYKHKLMADNQYLRVLDLQALLCDYFDCLGKANKFMSIYITFTVLLFACAVLIFCYLQITIAQLWSILVFKIVVIIIYVAFFLCATLILRLKAKIDRTYCNLCTLMALDISGRRQKWMLILDNYTYKGRDSFKFAGGANFGWPLVINLAASSVSLLILVETYKRR